MKYSKLEPNSPMPPIRRNDVIGKRCGEDVRRRRRRFRECRKIRRVHRLRPKVSAVIWSAHSSLLSSPRKARWVKRLTLIDRTPRFPYRPVVPILVHRIGRPVFVAIGGGGGWKVRHGTGG